MTGPAATTAWFRAGFPVSDAGSDCANVAGETGSGLGCETVTGTGGDVTNWAHVPVAGLSRGTGWGTVSSRRSRA